MTTVIQSEHNLSLEFLKLWAPEGPWILTAIDIERKGIDTRTFRPEEEEQLAAWLILYDQDRNFYFHVNPTTHDMTKKATRGDIKNLSWLHVDIDPRAGEDINEERQRALEMLQNPPGGLPPATAIVFSGGGYQGFWKLEEPFTIDGQETLYENAKRYNIQLEVIFSADNCHNVDRIMRLPGTVNRPDKKKREKGRTAMLAKLISWNDEAVYPLSMFTPAPTTQSASPTTFSGRLVEVSGNVERLDNVDDPKLKDVHDLAKVVIVQGNNPEDLCQFGKDGGTELDRSLALFYVCCEMVRGGCDDDTIYAVITDPDFGISESVLDKGSSAERYALRQISRARENAIDPHLEELNSQFAVISSSGGKCRVVEEVFEPSIKRYRLEYQTFADFKYRFMNQHVMVPGVGENANPKPVALGDWWLKHPNRRQYEIVTFAPGQDVPGAYNLWRGFACDSIPGDCSLSLNHIKRVICSGDEEHFNYLMGWMACSVQKLGTPGYSAVVLRGGQGTGKSFFAAKIFGSLFGRHFLHVSDQKHVTGSFNAHLRDCMVLFGDEAFYAGEKKQESVLKMLVSEDKLVIEAKGVDATVSANCLHVILASNEEWVVPTGKEGRRYFVLEVGNEYREDIGYFKAIQKELDNGGREALLHHLMSYDLSRFSLREVPRTKGLLAQKVLSMDPYKEWWYDKLKEGVVLPGNHKWEARVPKEELLYDFLENCRNFNTKYRGNRTTLKREMETFLPFSPNGKQDWQRRDGVSIEVNVFGREPKKINFPYYWCTLTLKQCRDHWDENFGGPYDWPEETEVGEPTDTPF